MPATPNWVTAVRECMDAGEESRKAMVAAVEAAFPAKSRWSYRGFCVTVNNGGFDVHNLCLWVSLDGPAGEHAISVKADPAELKPLSAVVPITGET